MPSFGLRCECAPYFLLILETERLGCQGSQLQTFLTDKQEFVLKVLIQTWNLLTSGASCKFEILLLLSMGAFAQKSPTITVASVCFFKTSQIDDIFKKYGYAPQS